LSPSKGSGVFPSWYLSYFSKRGGKVLFFFSFFFFSPRSSRCWISDTCPFLAVPSPPFSVKQGDLSLFLLLFFFSFFFFQLPGIQEVRRGGRERVLTPVRASLPYFFIREANRVTFSLFFSLLFCLVDGSLGQKRSSPLFGVTLLFFPPLRPKSKKSSFPLPFLFPLSSASPIRRCAEQTALRVSFSLLS